jgi:hypothetical protein
MPRAFDHIHCSDLQLSRLLLPLPLPCKLELCRVIKETNDRSPAAAAGFSTGCYASCLIKGS